MRQVNAQIRDRVMETVSEALYEEKRIEITYMAASSKSVASKTYTVIPYAMLHRGTVTELIGRIETDKKIRRWMMHRITKASMTENTAIIPRDFDLDDFVIKQLAYPYSGDDIVLKIWIRHDGINHVTETPLSKDQVIRKIKDGVIVTATVQETVELKWWLLGLGERVKVIKPTSLRADMKRTIIEMAANYKLHESAE